MPCLFTDAMFILCMFDKIEHKNKVSSVKATQTDKYVIMVKVN